MSHSMRVGHFVSFGLGGADKCSLNIIRGLISLGLEPIVFYNEFSIPRHVSSNHDVGYTPPSRMLQYKTLVRLVKIGGVEEFTDYGLDILHTQRSGSDRWLLPDFDKRGWPFKIVETNFHGDLNTRADVRVFPSHLLAQRSGVAVQCIPNAINRPMTKESLKEELGLGDRFVFGRIARPDKDIYSDLNLRAYASLENSNTHFLYVAPYSQARLDAENLGIKNITFLDPVIDDNMVSKIYNTFDVLCHSNSAGETFGNTIAEAMIHGKPVVSHYGAPRWPQAHIELFGDMTELVTKAGDSASYAANMRLLMDDSSYYNKVSSYLKHRAEFLYESSVVAQQYIDLYDQILANAK